MFGLIRQFTLISTLLGIGLLGLLPTTAEAGHAQYDAVVYQKGSVIMLIEPVCANKNAIIEIQNAIKEGWDKALPLFKKKEELTICEINVEVKVGDPFGTTVKNKKTKRKFFTFEAIRTSDGVTVYAIASGTYPDEQ